MQGAASLDLRPLRPVSNPASSRVLPASRAVRAGVPSFAFVLQPEFPLSAAVLASEALRCANQNRARELFRWCFVSQTGEPVRASNGLWMPVDHDIDSMPAVDFVLLFEGNLPTQRNSPRLLNRLRGVHSAGAHVGGVDTGAFALAQAGLIADDAAVLHWEAAPAFRERFPAGSTRDQLYRIDGRILHCAGGVSTLDLMLELIARRYGSVLATEVANALVHTPRPADAPQRVDASLAPTRRSLTDRMLALMEGNLDFPLGLEELAARLGVTARTVTRDCRRRFDDPPMRLYLRIRLQAARNLLFYEEFPIKTVATACGFSYPAVFSRTFKARFGETPSEFRASLRARQSEVRRPELRRLVEARAESMSDDRGAGAAIRSNASTTSGKRDAG